jgi:hypothetical protein
MSDKINLTDDEIEFILSELKKPIRVGSDYRIITAAIKQINSHRMVAEIRRGCITPNEAAIGWKPEQVERIRAASDRDIKRAALKMAVDSGVTWGEGDPENVVRAASMFEKFLKGELPC